MQEGVTILIVEDDDGHASLAERNLRRAGIHNTVTRFADGQDVLEFLYDEEANHPGPDEPGYLMLLDLRMPRVGGLEVLKRIKGDERWSNMPVIMLTTTDNPDEINECHEHGCNSYVTKPVEYEQFVEVLQRIGMFLLVVQVPQVKK